MAEFRSFLAFLLKSNNCWTL